eukprot:gene18807-20703_t
MAANMNPVDISSKDSPVKDVQATKLKFGLKERQIVSALARQDLEDKYLRLQEDYNELKKLSRTQDEKMKQMATKLVRLFNDKKKLDGADKGQGRDLKMMAHIEDLDGQIRNLKVANEQLKNKLSVAKQQLLAQGKKQTPYDGVKPRVSTGLARTQQQRIKEQIRAIEPKSSARAPQPLLPQPRYGHSLLEESRIEKRELEDLITSLQEQIKLLEEDGEKLREQSRLQEMDYDEKQRKLHSEINELKKASVQESSELIRLEREVKEKCTKLEVFQGKFANLEQIFEKVKASNEKALGEMDNLNMKLKEEQARNSSLRHEIREKDFSRTSLTEKDELISDLKNENSLLKETQEKLLQSTFDSERERRFRVKEREYQLKITQLETLNKSDVLEKNELLDKLSLKEDATERLQQELKELRVNFYSQKNVHDDLVEKFKFFSQESSIDVEEIHQAILLVKSRKEATNQELSFLEKVEEESTGDLRKQLLSLQTQHADTVNELEKSRGMLQMQYNINKDYQKEVQSSTRKLEETKKDCDMKLQEYAEMLDLRAERIKKLESQIKDIAYGTKQYRIDAETIVDSEREVDESLVTHELERGQNILEIQIGKATLTNNGLKKFAQADPQTFVTIEFFEYEMQATPVFSGQRPLFNFTSQFIVVADDFFLHHIAKESALIEMHQALGTDYKTLGSASLRMNDLLEKSQEPSRGVLHLYDEKEEVAMLEYSIRLRVPMEQALRLYRERSKALGYITINSQSNVEDQKRSVREIGMNELKIKILKCDQLKSKSSGQPSAYAVYKFFDFDDHDTNIITNSTCPVFNDEHLYPVTMNDELHNYLKTSALNIYMFDDKEDDATAIIGIAKVPLVSLSRDKFIRGTFQLTSQNHQSSSGSIEVFLQWQMTYLFNDKKLSRPTKMVEKPKIAASSHQDIMSPLDAECYKNIHVHSTAEDSNAMKVPAKVEGDTINENIKTVSFKEDAIVQPSDILEAEERTGDEMFSVNSEMDQTNQNEDVIADDEVENNFEHSDASLVEEELRKTVEAIEHPESPVLKDEIGEDTLFEEPISDISTGDDYDDDYEGVVVAKRAEMLSPTDDAELHDGIDSVATSDSEAVIVASPVPRATSSRSDSSAVVSIEVASLTLNKNASIYNLDKQVQLYVAYRFLDEDPATLETPDSLPLPPPDRPIHYNFKKIFHVDAENNEERNQQLMTMLLPDDKSEGRISFIIVAEPSDGEECEDAGIADVSLIQILQNNKDIRDEDIEVVDFDGELIGSLKVTVEALNALKSLYD